MKKLAIVLLAAITALSTLAFFACAKEVKLTEVTYLSGMPANVTVGETPDYSALKLTAKYSDGKTEEIAYNATDFTVTFDNTKAASNVEVTVTYKGLTCKTTTNVVAPVDDVKSIEYKSGLAESVYQNETPDYSALKILVKYEDDSEEEVLYNANDFTVTVDTSVVANNVQVKIAYKGFSCTTTINVKLYAEISGVELPAFASAYFTAIGSQTDFKDKTQAYIVGNANEFYFVPEVSAYDAEDELIPDFKTSFNANVQLMNGENPTEIENTAEYYTYNGETGAFLFTANADGKSFLIKTYPEGLTARQLENLDNYSVEFTVTVKDGYYNVYNAYDLFAMENRYESDNQRRETKPAYDFKRAHGVTVDCNALKGLALQTNITMTRETFPAEYFWTAEEVGNRTEIIGSLKDYTYMIYRVLGNNGTFAFEGNYFNINAKSLPMVLQEGNLANIKNPDEIVAHSKLFYVLGNSQSNGTSNTEYFVMRNVYSEGNLNRQESAQSGGLIYLEENGAKVDLYNCIATQWYITAFSSTTSDEHYLTVEKCIFKDDYNCIFYIWGGIIEVKETIAQGAGGPVFIADHAYFDDSNRGRNGSYGWTSDIRVDQYSAENMYSYVTGQEGWFKQMNATSFATLIKDMDRLFSLGGYGKRSFIRTENGKSLINVVAIFKAGGVESADGLFENATNGKGKFGKNEFNMENAFLNVPLESMGAGVTVGNSGMPVFFGSTPDTVFGYTNQMNGAFPVLVTPSGMINDASVLSLPIQQEDSGFVNALIGQPGKAGRFGLVLGNFHAINE